MSFRPASDVEPGLLSNKVGTSKFSPSLSNTIASTARNPVFTPAVAFTLAESSYLATAAATAAAYNWLFGFTTRSALLGTYKSVLKEVDMRNLDAPSI
jgi:hypothetical protein